jgi:diguanylate cyclase (GGDEF)-like protein
MGDIGTGADGLRGPCVRSDFDIRPLKLGRAHVDAVLVHSLPTGTHAVVDGLDLAAANPPVRVARPSRRRLQRRERWVETLAALAFLAVAVGMAIGLPDGRALDAGTGAMLVVAYALVRQARFDVGAGFVVPTHLVLVPMLFLLPAHLVPFAVAIGSLLGTGIDVLVRGTHPERGIVAIANAWFAVGPALVFALSGATEPTLAICVLAFAAQLATDFAASTTREWLCSAIPPHFQARVIALVAVVDGLLWPIGLLTALAALRDPLLALLVLPLAALLAMVAHERTARLELVRDQTTRLERAMHRLGKTFASGLDRDASLAIAVEAAIDVTDATTGRVVHARGDGAELGSGAAGSVEGLLCDAERAALEADGEVEAADEPSTAIAVALPAPAGDDDDETILLSVARPNRPFTADERERLHELARHAAVSVENVARHERLARQATTDELTGLLNHRRMHEVLEEEIARASRFRPPVALVMLDIDDFKRVNDTYGHQRGDEVLYEVARAVEAAARQGDHVARYGGEELAVVLPHAEIGQARLVAERIRERIARVEIELPDGRSIRPTASLGVATLSGQDDKQGLIAAADAALYAAKRSGKNRTVCAAQPAGARHGGRARG